MQKIALILLLILASSASHANPMCPAILTTAPRVEDLVKLYRQQRAHLGPAVIKADRLIFHGVGDRDVYNIARPMNVELQGRRQRVMLARVEPRENHQSEVWAFVADSESELEYSPAQGITHFKMEDPFFTSIDGELFVGGVETFSRSTKPGDLGYRTVFMRDFGHGLEFLQKFLTGPEGMKDIRFAKLANGKIQVSGRPQNSDPRRGGRGKNSQVIVDSVADITEQLISQAPIIENQIHERDWIGTNEIHDLKNGQIGFLSHVAHYSDVEQKNRGYYIAVFSNKDLRPKIILEREDLPGGLKSALQRKASKRDDLVNVLFGGGLERLPNGTAYLYIGAGDAESWRVLIRDPFL